MEGKPLGKERREEIETHSKTCAFNHQEMLTELLAAELYWREAVKNAEMVATCRAGDCLLCPFCIQANWSAQNEHGHDRPVNHKPDCPWVLAQG